MIPPIRDYYLRMMTEWSGDRAESKHPELWEFTEEEIEYLEQIQTPDDILNYSPDERGRMQALAHDCAIAMGLSRHDALGAAGDL